MNNIFEEPFGYPYPRKINISCILLFMVKISQNLINKTIGHLANYDIFLTLKSTSYGK